MKGLKKYLRGRLVACAPCYTLYSQAKYKLTNFISLRYFLLDAFQSWRYMRWGKITSMSKGQLHANLLFYYHKIEKGLSLPGKKRLFALDVVPRVIGLLEQWELSDRKLDDPIYVGAVCSLRAYHQFVSKELLDPDQAILPTVTSFLASRSHIPTLADTPVTVPLEHLKAAVSYRQYLHLCELRRSYRTFIDRPIPFEILQKAIATAQLSPSACNRQPCKVYAVYEPQSKKAILAYQNGNAGFGHLAPVVLVITADSAHFFGPIERNQPFVDGGLFSMSLLLGLQVQGLVSCCLNWCVPPTADIAVHMILDIPASERIVMFMLTGYPAAESAVPRSQRKSVDSVLSII